MTDAEAIANRAIESTIEIVDCLNEFLDTAGSEVDVFTVSIALSEALGCLEMMRELRSEVLEA